jgi:hypothetical protein
VEHSCVFDSALTRHSVTKKRLNHFPSDLLSLLGSPDNIAAHISNGKDSSIPEFTSTLVILIRAPESSNCCFSEAGCSIDACTIGLLFLLGLHGVYEHRSRESGTQRWSKPRISMCRNSGSPRLPVHVSKEADTVLWIAAEGGISIPHCHVVPAIKAGITAFAQKGGT